MRYLSWFGRKARTSRTLLLFVVLLMAVALSGASVPASAQAAPAHVASSGMASHLVVLRHAESLNNAECVPPAGTICVGTGVDTSNGRCTGAWADIVNRANHSVWETFAGQHISDPSCFDARNSGSAMWVEDANEDSGCVAPHQNTTVTPGFPPATIFFIRYNTPCGNEPGGEPS